MSGQRKIALVQLNSYLEGCGFATITSVNFTTVYGRSLEITHKFGNFIEQGDAPSAIKLLELLIAIHNFQLQEFDYYRVSSSNTDGLTIYNPIATFVQMFPQLPESQCFFTNISQLFLDNANLLPHFIERSHYMRSLLNPDRRQAITKEENAEMIVLRRVKSRIRVLKRIENEIPVVDPVNADLLREFISAHPLLF